MTEEENGKLFMDLKAERDSAKGELCLARRKASNLCRSLKTVSDAINGGAAWKATEGGLRFGPVGGTIMDGTVPTESDIRDVLETIQRYEKTIDEYNEFVK